MRIIRSVLKIYFCVKCKYCSINVIYYFFVLSVIYTSSQNDELHCTQVISQWTDIALFLVVDIGHALCMCVLWFIFTLCLPML